MANSESWLDFETLRHNIKHNTVDRLKHILNGLNEECGGHFSKSGKKQDIIDRIVGALDHWKMTNQEDAWLKAKAVIYQVRNSGTYTPPRLSAPYTASAPSASYYNSNHSMKGSAGYNGYSVNGIGGYNLYAPPRRPNSVNATAGTSKISQSKPVLTFRESPFYKIEEAVSAIAECPESTGAQDRKQQSVSFNLTTEQINKLKSPGSNYQLRLYCTSSSFYSTAATIRPNLTPALMEFPPTCEVRINNVALTANLKGLKKKPGTAPPPDITKFTKLSNNQNRVDMVYVNSQQPAQPRKYYLVINLVKVTRVEQLVEDLRLNKVRSSAQIKQKMKEAIGDDDDIVAGPQKMSLKCPLSFMRVNLPCRSVKCVHPQCFDATSWFSMMEQTSTWLCPVCEHSLDCADLIIDGYFEEILNKTSDSVDDVIVEADGEWHTADNVYGSDAWTATHPPVRPPSSAPPPPPRQKSPPKESSYGEIVILDSDDEDEGRVNRELHALSPRSSIAFSVGTSRTSVPPSQSELVIDLTVDSDNEEPPASRATKRRADEAGISSQSSTEPSWKRSRSETQNSQNGPEYSPPRVSVPLTARGSSGVPFGGQLPPPPFTGGRPVTNGVNRLPPINGGQQYRGWT